MPRYDKKKELKRYQFDIKTNDKNAIQVYCKGNFIEMELCDDQLGKKKRKRKMTWLFWNAKKFVYIGQVQCKEEYFLIASSVDHGNSKHYVVAFRVNLNDLTLEKDPLVLVTLDDQVYTRYEDEIVLNGNLEDKTVIKTFKYVNNVQTEVCLHVFNDEFKNTLNQKLVFPPDDKVRYVSDVYFEDEDHVLISTYTGSERNMVWAKNGAPNYQPKLYYFTNHLKNSISYPIGKQGHYMTSYLPVVSDKGEIVVAGFYSKSSFLFLDGVYTLRIDAATGEVLHETYSEISQEQAATIMGKKAQKIAQNKQRRTGEYSLPEFNLRYVYVTPNGHIKIVAEDIASKDAVRVIYPFVIPSINYRYGSLLVFDMDPSGKISWANGIRKYGKTKRHYKEHFAVTMKENGELVFLFNYNLSNNKSDRLHLIDGKTKSAPVIARLSNTGQKTIELVCQPKSISELMYPHSFKTNEDGTAYVKIRRKKKVAYYKLNI